MSIPTGPLPLTSDLFYAIDWWVDAAKPRVIHGRHCDRAKIGQCLITLGSDDTITVSRETGDRFEKAYIDAAIAAGPALIRKRADEALSVNAKLKQLAAGSNRTKSSVIRDWAQRLETEKHHDPLTDRVAATSLTVSRARTVLVSVMCDHPVFDWQRGKEIIPSAHGVTATPAPAPSIDLSEISRGDTTSSDATSDDDREHEADMAMLEDARRARAVLEAIDIDLDKLVVELAPTPVAPATGNAHRPTPGFDVPMANPHFTVPKDSAWHHAFEALDLAHVAGSRKNLLVTGPTGCGKTEGANHYAATRKRPAITIDCTQLVEPTDAFGAMIAEEGTTRFVPSKMCEALATTDAVVILDEVNRAHPKVLNSLFSILDGRGSARIDCVLDGDGNPVEVKVASNVVIVMTANIGASYRGAQRMDDAFINRADCTVRVDYLTAAQECKLLTACTGISKPDAEVISKLATWTRQQSAKLAGGEVTSAASTRKSVCAARMVAEGLHVARACKLAVVDCYHDDTERAAATAHLIKLTGK